MTVSYTRDIANGGNFVCFWRALGRWRGSLYKLVWQDLLVYTVAYGLVEAAYRFALGAAGRQALQKFSAYVGSDLALFPVPFVLSFFVDQVATKWWHQYQMIPSPDTLAIYANATIPGRDNTSRMMRRTIVRYAILSLVLTMRNISVRIKKRFPTMEHIQEAGLILEEERRHYDRLDGQANGDGGDKAQGQSGYGVAADHWMPLVWAANVATRANAVRKVSSEQCLRLLIGELTAHRDKLGILVGYDLVSIPLVYTQTMVAVVVSYLALTLIGRRPLAPDSVYAGIGGGGFTMSTFSDFVIFVGLMKVATVMLNPFGEDDDDFEVCATVDRHITAAYMIVDEMHDEQPEVVKDAYWDDMGTAAGIAGDDMGSAAGNARTAACPEGLSEPGPSGLSESVYANVGSPRDALLTSRSPARSPSRSRSQSRFQSRSPSRYQSQSRSRY